jgi:integrase
MATTSVMSKNESTLRKNKISDDLEKRIGSLTACALPYYNSIFKDLYQANRKNAEILCDFISTEYTNQNIKTSTKLTHIKVICWFSKYLDHKNFQLVTRDDIIDYLGSMRKSETQDPTHKWIGTYNTRQMILSKFFRWLYNKNEHDSKKWITPSCMEGIRQLARKEKSSYRPSDIWTNEEHALFLKYCPEKRDRCYHAMANDTSCRPHELLSLKIKDIVFKLSSTKKQYAEVHITESKTNPRTLPLIFSIPYVKDWIDSHPMRNNPNAFLFISLADSNYGEQLSENSLYKQYTRRYRKFYFPKLIDSSIPDLDKSYLRNLLTKPWNPFILRHSALTAKSQILKESILRDHAGWTLTSKMPNRYIHYFGNESAKSLLEAYGIENYHDWHLSMLKSRTCPNCNEPNKVDSKFCSKCRMILTYNEYVETLEKQKEKDNELEKMREEICLINQREFALKLKREEEMQYVKQKLNHIALLMQQNPEFAILDPDVRLKMKKRLGLVKYDYLSNKERE